MKLFQKKGMALFILLISLSSCGKVYFTDPQPSDVKNKYRFPNSLRGTWYEKNDSLTIGKNYFSMQRSTPHRIAQSEIDTSNTIVLKNNKIYFISSTEKLHAQGVPYVVQDDTIIYTTREMEYTELGKNTFIRKINKQYLFNIRNKKNWWELYLLERTKNKHVIVRVLDKDKLTDANSPLDEIHRTKYDRYYAGQWTKKQLSDLIEQGAFSDTIFNLSPLHKVKP